MGTSPSTDPVSKWTRTWSSTRGVSSSVTTAVTVGTTVNVSWHSGLIVSGVSVRERISAGALTHVGTPAGVNFDAGVAVAVLTGAALGGALVAYVGPGE